jgi:VWFA-related protein
LPVALLLLTVSSLPAERLTERVEVIATEVPVHVTLKNGEPVRGLTVENFEVLDNGKRQPITAFEVHDLSLLVPREGEPLEVTAASLAARRHIMILFDFSFSRIGSLQRSREAAIEVMRERLAPSDLAGVATYSATQGAKLVLNFTSDRQQVEQAIRALGYTDGSRSVADPLALTFIEPSQMTASLPIVEGAATDPAQMAEDHLRLMQVTANKSDKRARQQQVTNLAKDFTTLARLLDAVPGRKDILYLSEGFANDLAFASQNDAEIAQMNQSRESGEIWNVDTAARFGDVSLQSDLNRMLESLRKADCVIHAIDIGGSGVVDSTEGGQLSRRSGGNQGLSLMASETGGSYTRNTNEFDGAMERVMQSTSVTYVLTIQPRDLARDGKFHKLKVRLKNAPKGARATHRPGYYAPTPYAEQGPNQRQLQIAGQLLAETAGGAIPTSALAVPFARPGGKALVPVVLEIDGQGLLRDNLGDVVTAQVFAYALDTDGKIRDLFTKTIGVDLNQAGETMRQTGIKFYGTFELEPGDYRLRLLVMNAQTGLSSLEIVDLSVPDGAPDAALVLPPLLPDPYGKWLLARQEAPADGVAPPFPFMLGEQPYLPAARAALQSGTAMPLYIVVHNLDLEGLSAVGILTAADGSTREIDLGALEPAATGVSSYAALAATLDTADVAPGDYELSVVVRQAGEALTSGSIPVSISR